MKSIYTAGFALLALGATVVPTQAQSLKDVPGVATCPPLISSDEILKRPDGTSLRRNVGTCIQTYNAPFPFDSMKETCSYSQEMSADNKPILSHGYCDILSSKGDRAAVTIIYDGPNNQGRWEFFSGTGAYAGIKGHGTFKVKTPFPGGGAVYDTMGSWEIDKTAAAK